MSSRQPLSKSELENYAISLLSRREYGAEELLMKLNSRSDSESAQAVLLWLQEQNLQSDSRYARLLLRSKSQRGLGPLRIRQEMQQKRLASDMIGLAFEECEQDWFELARQVYLKKFPDALSSDPKDRARRQRFLHYRGFTGDQIGYALEQGHQECTNY